MTSNVLLKKDVAYDILKYLLTHKKEYLSQFSRKIDRTISSIAINLQSLLHIECIKQTGSKNRKYYSITAKGIFLINELVQISNKT